MWADWILHKFPPADWRLLAIWLTRLLRPNWLDFHFQAMIHRRHFGLMTRAWASPGRHVAFECLHWFSSFRAGTAGQPLYDLPRFVVATHFCEVNPGCQRQGPSRSSVVSLRINTPPFRSISDHWVYGILLFESFGWLSSDLQCPPMISCGSGLLHFDLGFATLLTWIILQINFRDCPAGVGTDSWLLSRFDDG